MSGSCFGTQSSRLRTGEVILACYLLLSKSKSWAAASQLSACVHEVPFQLDSSRELTQRASAAWQIEADSSSAYICPIRI